MVTALKAQAVRRQRLGCDGVRNWFDPRIQGRLQGAIPQGVRIYKVAENMPKTIHLKNIPDALRQVLELRAAAAGMSLSDYLMWELRRAIRRPSPEEMLDRLQQRESYSGEVSPTHVLRQERDRR